VSEVGHASIASAPVNASARIESLDILRGFALLGVLLLNILAFGMASMGYFHPHVGLGENSELNYAIWGIVNLFFEGSMRGLFSMLFGAGIVLFTTGFGSHSGTGKSGWLHYKRTFFLLLFGLFDAYVLLWTGDILILYAIAGAMLYPLRKCKPKTLILLSVVVLLCSSMLFATVGTLMNEGRDAAAIIDANPEGNHSDKLHEQAELWYESGADFTYNETQIQDELDLRRGSYSQVAKYSAKTVNEHLTFFTPVFMMWDAIGMMLLGMATYRLGFLSAERSKACYLRLAGIGFSIGLLINGFELYQAIQSNYDVLVISGYFQGTYHLGRVSMAFGWLGLVMLVCQGGLWSSLRVRLAAVGRTALSNYLLHSLLCLILFTGAGFGLIGTFERWELYGIVMFIWLLQLFVSAWWLKRYAFGPAEWLWRTMTYGSKQKWRL
tara:strand:- start:1480 stop:2793 length:1314 start_codon:yes stop_codon:yes gene_type:complete